MREALEFCVQCGLRKHAVPWLRVRAVALAALPDRARARVARQFQTLREYMIASSAEKGN